MTLQEQAHERFKDHMRAIVGEPPKKAYWTHMLAALDVAMEPVMEFVVATAEHEPSPCSFDHHGYCQEHGGGDINGQCIVAAAKAGLGIE